MEHLWMASSVCIIFNPFCSKGFKIFKLCLTILWPFSLKRLTYIIGCGFESCFPLHSLSFRYRVCFEQGVPWHSGNYRVWTHFETRCHLFRFFFSSLVTKWVLHIKILKVIFWFTWWQQHQNISSMIFTKYIARGGVLWRFRIQDKNFSNQMEKKIQCSSKR